MMMPGVVSCVGHSSLQGRTRIMIFLDLLKDESGASAAEYALILAIVGTGIAFAALGLGGAITNSMKKATNCISGTAAADGTCTAPAAGG
jgi:pilus assembly protein Flp/PilA